MKRKLKKGNYSKMKVGNGYKIGPLSYGNLAGDLGCWMNWKYAF